MTRTSKLAPLFAAALLVTLAFAAEASGVPPWAKPAHPRRVPLAGFTVGGVYGGMLGGDVIIDGASYHLRPKTQAYLMDVGLVPMSSVTIGSHVFAAGVGADDTGFIGSLMVRPADEARAGETDMSGFVHVRVAGAPE